MTVSSKHFMRRIKNIHFIGIGGVGMSGIAEVFHNLGYVISGSDIAESAMVRHLRGLGMTVHLGHAERQTRMSRCRVDPRHGQKDTLIV